MDDCLIPSLAIVELSTGSGGVRFTRKSNQIESNRIQECMIIKQTKSDKNKKKSQKKKTKK